MQSGAFLLHLSRHGNRFPSYASPHQINHHCYATQNWPLQRIVFHRLPQNRYEKSTNFFPISRKRNRLGNFTLFVLSQSFSAPWTNVLGREFFAVGVERLPGALEDAELHNLPQHTRCQGQTPPAVTTNISHPDHTPSGTQSGRDTALSEAPGQSRGLHQLTTWAGAASMPSFAAPPSPPCWSPHCLVSWAVGPGEVCRGTE